MSFINYSTKEINFKIVYHGPGLSGKTLNLKAIYNRVKDTSKSKLISLSTDTGRTLFFDFFPFSLGKVKGYEVKFHLYSVPGQIYYSSSRKLILKGTDGIVFVADSQKDRFEANIEMMKDMMDHLKEYDIDFNTLPYVLQLNKRDLPDALPVNAMLKYLRQKDEPVIEASAEKGEGVIETLKAISKLIMVNVKQKIS
ncbi:MAG: GTPase domain-containing protein [Candidatus Aminicenantes bacterium]|nr:GTPase domain-containing protein [Candidatus Aminicenantes bacterium]